MEIQTSIPDLLVVVIDTNCTTWNQAHQEIEGAVDGSVFPVSVVGCPDPHVECWCVAYPSGFRPVIGVPPPADPDKCERDVSKNLLRTTIQEADLLILVNDMEFSHEIVDALDLYHASKRQPSLGHFIDDLKAALMSMRR